VPLRELPGVLHAGDLRLTASSIARVQEPGGAIPWFPRGHTDPWDHVEAAMGLDAAGRHDEAQRAYAWLRRVQRPDGSWAAAYRNGAVADDLSDANFCAYVATGTWHHFRCTDDLAFLQRMWPTVRRAVEFVLGLQAAGGEIHWSRGRDGKPSDEALLTGCSSMYQSLRCALAIAAELGRSEPDWELAAGALGHAVAWHPERFTPKDRWSMDWYYPVLGGALRGDAATRRIAAGWGEFVVPGLGVRCVADRPWVTGAESCELALSLAALGRRAEAAEVIGWIQHLRDPDGAYWTGYVYDTDARWPIERTTWTAAAVLLAVDALDPASATAEVFTGATLPAGVDPADGCDEACLLVADGV
jgi:hypothetical protein